MWIPTFAGMTRAVAMTNRMDLYQPESKELAIPACGAFVFVEGRLCPYLEVVEITQQGMGGFGSARMAWHSDSGKLPDEIEISKSVVIKWIYNNLYPAGGAEGIVIFAGEIERIETKLGPDGETIEVVARDFSATLERITVFGRWICDINERMVFIEGERTIFNESGQPNASSEPVEHNGNSVRLFAANTSQARLWDCADVIRYLLCEYLPAGQLFVPEDDRLRAIAGDESVRDLNVTGMSLLDALEKCCGQAGLEFRFVPRLSESGPSQGIVFCRKGSGRGVELNLQQQGGRLSVSKTNIWKATSKRESPLTHRYVGQGDYKVFEATFDLVKGWHWQDEDVDYEKFSPSTNPEFHKVRDVWRKWCLNETGEYTSPPFVETPAHDFTYVFGTDKFAHRRRRFWPAISCDSQGRSLGYFLEVSYDDGDHWWQYMHAFDNLLDECGIWLASDKLDIDTWIAALKGVLRFRLTASVVSDERLSCTVADGPVGGIVPVVERIVNAGGGFKFRKVTGKSIFTGFRSGLVVDQIDTAGFGADETDDSAALMQFVRRRAQADAAAIETFDVQTPYLAVGFEVGDIVKTNPEDKDIFSARSDNRSTSVIEKVRMDFRKQSTQLKVVRKRKT